MTLTITADDDLTELDVTLRRYHAPDRGVGDRGDFDFTATGPDGAPWELSQTEQQRAREQARLTPSLLEFQAEKRQGLPAPAERREQALALMAGIGKGKA